VTTKVSYSETSPKLWNVFHSTWQAHVMINVFFVLAAGMAKVKGLRSHEAWWRHVAVLVYSMMCCLHQALHYVLSYQRHLCERD